MAAVTVPNVLATRYAAADLAQICVGDEVVLEAVHGALRAGGSMSARIGDREVPLRHRLSQRQVDMVLAGGRIPLTAQAV